MLKPLKVKDAIAKMRRNPNFVHLDKVDSDRMCKPHTNTCPNTCVRTDTHTHSHTESRLKPNTTQLSVTSK